MENLPTAEILASAEAIFFWAATYNYGKIIDALISSGLFHNDRMTNQDVLRRAKFYLLKTRIQMLEFDEVKEVRELITDIESLETDYKENLSELDEISFFEIKRSIVHEIARSFLRNQFKVEDADVTDLAASASSPDKKLIKQNDIHVPPNFKFDTFVKKISDLLKKFKSVYEGDFESHFETDLDNYSTKLLAKGNGKQKTVNTTYIAGLLREKTHEIFVGDLLSFIDSIEAQILPQSPLLTISYSGIIANADWKQGDKEARGPYQSASKSKETQSSSTLKSPVKDKRTSSNKKPSASSKLLSTPQHADNHELPIEAAEQHKLEKAHHLELSQLQQIKNKYDSQDPLREALGPAEATALFPTETRKPRGRGRKRTAASPAPTTQQPEEVLTQPQHPVLLQKNGGSKAKKARLIDNRSSSEKIEFNDDEVNTDELEEQVSRRMDTTSSTSTSSTHVETTISNTNHQRLQTLAETIQSAIEQRRIDLPDKLSSSPTKKLVKGGGGEQRGRKRWTHEEETALRTALRLYGVGKWAFILHDSNFGPILRDRNNVDLKDKYRIMLKKGTVDLPASPVIHNNAAVDDDHVDEAFDN